MATEIPEPEIVLLPDPGSITFDEQNTPILTFEDADGWALYFMEPDGNGVEHHRIGGPLDAVDWAIEQARAHLRWAWSAEARP